MNFLLDENFPKSAKSVLEAAGHTVHDFRELGVRGACDEDVAKMAIELSSIILTTDRDFFHTLGRQNSEHSGIIVIALKQPTRTAIIERLTWLLGHVATEVIPGRTFQLRDKTWMVYPPI